MNKGICTLLLLFTLWSCGDSIVSPEVCSDGPTSVSVHIGQTELVEPCFVSELPVVYYVESLDTAIATAELRNEVVHVRGQDIGETIIRITASNGEAEGIQDVDVRVPNRDPETVGEPDLLYLPPEGQLRTDVSVLFEDKDRQELNYSVEVDARGVASATIENDTLIVTGLLEGEANATVTVSDGYADATAIVPVEVGRMHLIYREDFEDCGLCGWRKSMADGFKPDSTEEVNGLRVKDGVLELWGTEDTYPPQYAPFAAEPKLATWFDVRARLRTMGDTTGVRLWLALDTDSEWKWMELSLQTYAGGEEEDCVVFRAKHGPEGQIFYTYCGPADFRVGEWTEVRLRYWNQVYEIQINGGETILTGYPPETVIPQIKQVSMRGIHENQSGEFGEKDRVGMDWIEVWGMRVRDRPEGSIR